MPQARGHTGHVSHDANSAGRVIGPKIIKQNQPAIAKDVIAVLNRDPAMVERVIQLGMVVQENGTAHYAKFMQDDLARYAAIVRKLSLQIQ